MGNIRQASESRMQEIRELIAFYDKRGANWLSAAEFTLGLRSGADEQRRHWLQDFIMIPKRGKKR
jgi:hypothetical protein